MMTKVKLSDLEAGDIIIADGGFTCMKAGLKKVYTADGGLYVKCNQGRHYLVGQLDSDGTLSGMEKVHD
jgi:hypothetical protein